MTPVNAKHLTDRVVIQEVTTSDDGYGSFTYTYEDVKAVSAKVYTKSKSYLDSAGQRILIEDVKCVIRNTEISSSNRVVFKNGIFTIVGINKDDKGTQIELTLQNAGFTNA